MSFPEAAETPSLLLDRLTVDDTAALRRVMTGPDAAPLREAMDWSDDLDSTAVQQYVVGYVDRWECAQCASYLVRERGSERVAGLGFCYLDDAELGLWLHPDFWGRGYGGELLDRLTEIVAGQGCDPVWAETARDNERAVRLLGRWADRHGGRDEGVVAGTDGPTRRFVVADPA